VCIHQPYGREGRQTDITGQIARRALLAITDIGIPRPNYPGCLKALQEYDITIEIGVSFGSETTSMLAVGRGLDTGQNHFLTKPFTAKAVRAARGACACMLS